ncbi:MAG TPA: hypothetical protein PKI08_07510, partial [Aquaticitalea sp.]|nr:hypothetical protein [Aquaticitalea sp.]
YNSNKPYEGPTNQDPNMCLPVDTKQHSYVDDSGQHLSGHWVVFKGKATYQYDVTKQLRLKDSTTMHHIAVHLHPFAETMEFRDKTLDTTLFVSIAENHKDKIGLKKVSYFSSVDGIMLYPDHNYELVLKVNNTSDVNQDMMGSMFVFLFDKEMAEKTKAYNQLQ